MARPLYEIAKEAQTDWNTNSKSGVNPAARPYLNAMKELNSIEDYYGLDSGKGVVLYFLANAGTWRGETARRIKAELKELAGVK